MNKKLPKKTTIYDIAKEIGVSTATVSRVLSNSGYPVKEELRKKIQDTAEKLNYSVNIVGRMLKKNISMDIGVIIPTITNPFYSQLLLGIDLEARKKDYNILLCNSLRDRNIEKKYIELLYQKQVSGLIISSIDENHSFLKKIQDSGVKVVAFDQDIEDFPCSKVGFDYTKGGIIATSFLISMGHTNIAFLSSPLNRKNRKDTAEGYRLALIQHGLSFDENNIITSISEEESETGTYEFENGKNLISRFLQLKNRPTAIFAVNDMTALGIIQELSNRGLSVPEDVSVIGFDNIELASMVNPPLTTVNQPAYETGRLACKILLSSMENNSNETIILEPNLVIRKSVRQIKFTKNSN